MRMSRNTTFIGALILGVLLMIRPWYVSNLFGIVAGVLIAGNGAMVVAAKVKEHSASTVGMLSAVVRIIIGLIIIFNPGSFISIFPRLLGICMIAEGITGLTAGYEWNRVSSIVLIVIGLILVINPLGIVHLALFWFGVALAAYGVVGLVRTNGMDRY